MLYKKKDLYKLYNANPQNRIKQMIRSVFKKSRTKKLNANALNIMATKKMRANRWGQSFVCDFFRRAGH
jgi:RNase P protein component